MALGLSSQYSKYYYGVVYFNVCNLHVPCVMEWNILLANYVTFELTQAFCDYPHIRKTVLPRRETNL